MNDLFGQPVFDPLPHKPATPNGYARRPGTGPAGETCGTCAHCIGTGAGKHTYYKCQIIRFRWTRGPGTDILKKSAACECWSKKP